MPALLLLVAALAAPAAPLASTPRLAVEGIGIGDPEGRVITLMPTARCSDVRGASGVAERWCRIPEQAVFGVNPDSLSLSLVGDRVLGVVARVSAQRWPRLRAGLLQRLGEPAESSLRAQAAPGDEAAGAGEALRWVGGDSELLVAPAPDGHIVLTLRQRADPLP